jgi:class 3 adenylate cyclase
MSNFYSLIVNFNKKVFLALGFFFIFYSGVYCQDQKIADSLETIYSKQNFKEQDRLKILEELAINISDPEKKLTYSLELIQTAQELDSIDYLITGFMLKGNVLRNKGDYSKALKSHIRAAKLATEVKSNYRLALANNTIADDYSEIGNHNNAISYYQSAIDILRKENDSLHIANALYNAGDEYFNVMEYDSAMLYFKESSLIFKNLNDLNGTAYNLGSIGTIFAEQGKYVLAKENIEQAIIILEELEQYSAISEFLISLSDIEANQNDFSTAFSHAERSLELAQKYGLKNRISDANLQLSELYEKVGDMGNSLKYFKNYIVYRDSVKNIESVQKMADLRTNFEIQKTQDEILVFKKEKVITELKAKRQTIMNIAFASLALFILLLAISYYRRYRLIKKTSSIIQKETDKSEKLLLNILPEETALELKLNGKVQAKKFDSVSVMFTDFKDFTHYSHNLSPEELVNSVDFYYSKFDAIIEKCGLEKIKTIGDSYMCAGGLPFPTKDHAEKIMVAAFEIVEFMERSRKLKDNHISHFDIRVGINTGPVVAGVVGSKKFAYDIWGDTVNVASRMESTSVPGKINVSEYTYELIKDKYDCEYRGEVYVKNKGMMKMYFVNGLKEKDITHDPGKEELKL